MNQITDEVMNDTDYKELIIDIDRKLNIREESIFKNLFAKFPEDEFTCDISEDSLTVFLNSVDLEFLKKTINIIKADNLTNGMSNILDSIITNIESIKSYGLKGSKRIYIGYNKERKVKNRKAKEINRNQYYYANNNNFSTINNIIPGDFENKIIWGDSVDVLKKLPDNCIDLVFTSPPYNFGLDYESNEDAHHWDNYFNKLFSIFEECIRVLKYGGRIVVNIQPLFSDYIPSHHVISNYFMSKKMIWKGEVLWEKNNYNCKYTAWGTQKNNHYGIHVHAN